MSEMVEKVARAIFSTNYHPDDGEFANRMFDNDDHPQEKRRAYRAARAAIEAMREPTEDMLGGRYSAPLFSYRDDYVSREEVIEQWQGMIQAALSVSDEQP